jgi:tRNA modification GTPase
MSRAIREDTIAAISTPIGEGGIGIVRLSGPDSLVIGDEIFSPADGIRPSKCPTHTIRYGHIMDSKPKTRNSKPAAIVDEVLLTVMRAPKSYTKEDIVEINCHGGIRSLKKVLDLALRRGCRLAQPGEFSKRAFLNGRIDLAQAEAVLDVIRAKTDSALKVAVAQLEGGLSKRVNSVLDALVDIAAPLEASIDFPEEGMEPAGRRDFIKRTDAVIRELERLSGTYGEGAILREGVLAIICGKPNVGKSSLMNLLLKRDRVIVSPIPGTTRDAVEEMIGLKGIPVRLVDTAGIADTKDAVEREGVARSKRYLALADIAILVLDYSAKLDPGDMTVIKMVSDKKKVIVLNKCDLAKKIDMNRVRKLFPGGRIVAISVQKKKNIDGLEEALSSAIWAGGFTQGEGEIVSNARHKELLDKALGNMLSVRRAFGGRDAPPELIAIDLKEAMYHLGLITGRSVSDDLLNGIFERFCIGK